MKNPTMRELGLMGARGDLGRRILGSAENSEYESESYEEKEGESYLDEIISPSDIVDAIYNSGEGIGPESAKMQWIVDKMQTADEESEEKAWDWLAEGEEENEEEDAALVLDEYKGEDWSFLDEMMSDDLFKEDFQQKSLINSEVKRNKGNTGKTPAGNHSGSVPKADKKINMPTVGRNYVDVKLDVDNYEVDGDVIDEEELEMD